MAALDVEADPPSPRPIPLLETNGDLGGGIGGGLGNPSSSFLSRNTGSENRLRPPDSYCRMSAMWLPVGFGGGGGAADRGVDGVSGVSASDSGLAGVKGLSEGSWGPCGAVDGGASTKSPKSSDAVEVGRLSDVEVGGVLEEEGSGDISASESNSGSVSAAGCRSISSSGVTVGCTVASCSRSWALFGGAERGSIVMPLNWSDEGILRIRVPLSPCKAPVELDRDNT